MDQEEQAMMDEAVTLAEESDVAIMVLGGNEKTVREGIFPVPIWICADDRKTVTSCIRNGQTCDLVIGRRTCRHHQLG